MSLADHVAVVSGATSDIGRAICARLAAADARLCLTGRDPARLEAVAGDLGRATDRVCWYSLDLTAAGSVQSFAARLARDLGQLDVLVHGAGSFEMGRHRDASVESLDRQYRVNVRGPYLLTHALLPLLRESRGQVVFMNSTVGLEARAGVGQYASTQHARRAIADALRAEVNADGIRVLTMYLGRTASARQAQIFGLEGRTYQPDLLMQPGDVAEMLVTSLCVPRTAEVTEIRMRPLVKSY